MHHVFDRPARVAILLAQLGGLVRPFRQNAAFLDVALLATGIALLRRSDNPMRSKSAMPRASFRSVLTIMADNAALSPANPIERTLGFSPAAKYVGYEIPVFRSVQLVYP